jgi:hypothetical protein
MVQSDWCGSIMETMSGATARAIRLKKPQWLNEPAGFYGLGVANGSRGARDPKGEREYSSAVETFSSPLT